MKRNIWLLAGSVFLWAILGSLAVPAAAQAGVTVTSANPSTAPQGSTNLIVKIGGSGFNKKGASASFFVSGSTTNPGGITVNSTTFVSKSEVDANITVSSTATLSGFDIYVTSGGRTGKGTDLFTVTSNNGSGGPSCNSYNVTTVLYDTDSNSVPFQFQSDGKGAYTTYSSGKGRKKDSAKSVIAGNCHWSLDTTSSLSRGISVTLAYPYSSGSPAPFTGPQVVKGRINTHCSTNTGNNGVEVGNMTYTGQTLVCPFNVAFYAPNGVWYNIGLNPYNWPETTMAQVTCTGASGGQCNQWTIVPDPATSVVDPTTNQLSSIGELISPPCVGCSGGTPLGLYLFSYSFLIHK